MSRVTVVTDSAAALPADLAARHGIRVVPLWLVIGDERHRDGDVTLDDVVSRFAEPISTSAPSPGEFAEVIAAARSDGPVVVLTVSQRMSTTFESAVLAAKLVADDAHIVGATPGSTIDAAVNGASDAGDAPRAPRDDAVSVIDTGAAAGAQALVVLAAARTAADGADAPGVVAAAEMVAGRVRLVATVTDLERLAASGRVPEAARRLGDRLGVQPLFEFRDGRARPLRPAFSPRVARDRIVARCVADAPGGRRGTGGRLHVAVLHALDQTAADELVAQVTQLDPASCLVAPFSPAMVAHTGRGLAGLAWWWAP
jgi:DegV family protein with EDD domain